MANDVKPDDVKRPAPGPKPAGRGAEAAAPPPGRMVGAWITVILLAGLLASLWLNGAEKHEQIPYNPDFVELVGAGLVEKAEIFHDAGINVVKGETRLPSTASPRAAR